TPHYLPFSLHDALPIYDRAVVVDGVHAVLQHLFAETGWVSRKRVVAARGCQTVARRCDQAVHCHVRAQVKRAAINTRISDVQLRSEEHTSELQSRSDLV